MNIEKKIFKLKQLTKNIVTGGTPPQTNKKYFGKEYPFITPSDMRGEKWCENTERNLSKESLKIFKNNLIPKNSIATSCIGMQMGKSVMVAKPSFTNQQINSLIPNELVDPDYLYYVMLNHRDKLLSMGSALGARTPIVNKTLFSEYAISIHKDLKTQKKISSILSSFDDLIRINKNKAELLNNFCNKIFEKWFVDFKFSGYEKTSFRQTKLGKIPKDWKIKKISDLINRISPGKLYSSKTALSKGKVPILDQGQTGIIGYHNNKPGVIAGLDKPVITFANHTCYQNILHHSFSTIQNVIPFYENPKYIDNIYWLFHATKDKVKLNDYKGHWPELVSKNIIVPNKELVKNFGILVKPIHKNISLLTKKNKILKDSLKIISNKFINE